MSDPLRVELSRAKLEAVLGDGGEGFGTPALDALLAAGRVVLALMDGRTVSITEPIGEELEQETVLEPREAV